MALSRDPQSALPSSARLAPAAAGEDRRESGKRARARDRLMDRATKSYPQTEALSATGRLQNLLIFIDDDLRETALAIERVERYLVSTLEMLETPKLERAQVVELATDSSVLDHVDALNETLESMRRRMAKLAASLK